MTEDEITQIKSNYKKLKTEISYISPQVSTQNIGQSNTKKPRNAILKKQKVEGGEMVAGKIKSCSLASNDAFHKRS